MSSKTLAEFIAEHELFRFEEAVAALKKHTTAASIAVGLNYHVGKKHLVRLRRGLYCRDARKIDVWQVASKVTSDAVIAYDSALRFHFSRGAVGHELQLLSEERLSHFVFDDCVFRAIRLHKHRLRHELSDYPAGEGILDVEHQGMNVRVVSRERAFVDCFDRPDLTEGLEEVAALFFKQRNLRPDALYYAAYANKSAICAARLGLFMESHRQLHMAVSTIELLMKMKPRTPTVFDPANKNGLCATHWNAILPDWFLELRGHRHHIEPRLL